MKNTKRKTRTAAEQKRIRRNLSNAPGKPSGFLIPRHLARSIAKGNMTRAGVEKVNRKFADTWKRWVRA